MKIIKVDNFNREEVADQLIAENVNEYWGEQLVNALNYVNSSDFHNDAFFRLVEDDYKLWGGMSELV